MGCLGREEWGIPDSKDFESWSTDADVAGYYSEASGMRYFGLYATPSSPLTLSAVRDAYHPYMNGWVNEVSIDDTVSPPTITAVKHYSMGRYAIEIPYCVNIRWGNLAQDPRTRGMSERQ
eukprot:1191448-Prorocentrum_minimum.AAC.6